LADVQHDHTDCHTGNNIEQENVRQGTGDKPLCQECARLGGETVSPKQVQLHVSADVLGVQEGEERPQLAVYAFSPGGSLLASTALEEKAETLPIPPESEAQAVRVLIGPPVDVEEARTLAELLRLGAVERAVRVNPDTAEARLDFALTRTVWLCWLRSCTVRGRLLKRVTSGGVPIELPVCGAEVEIYEVDRLRTFIAKIPASILERIREVVRFPPPPPRRPEDGPFGPFPPGPGPGPDPLLEVVTGLQRELGAIPTPQPPISSPAESAFVTRTELSELVQERFQEHGETAPAAAPEDVDRVERTVALIPEAPEAPDPAEAADALRALAESDEVRSAARQGTAAFRQALVNNAIRIVPFLCPFASPLVTEQLVATATTDDCGRFQAIFWQGGCSDTPSDTPDLYFVAYRRFGSFRVPIYQPLPVGCHTRWDYDCATEVTLYTTSPLAHTCPPARPVIAGRHWVLVMAIGHLSLASIHGTGASLGTGDLPATKASNIGLTDGGAPFGGLLRPRLEFDNSLRGLGPSGNPVRYYRVSWRKQPPSAPSDPFLPLELEVHRHYTHAVGSSLVLEAYSLGSHEVGGQAGLFEIPPALPPIGQWSIPDAVEDTTSAKFDTGRSSAPFGFVPPVGAGLYTLRVELFHEDGAPVDIGALGIHFVVPTSTDLSDTINTVEASSLGLVPGPPVGTGNAFEMTLHVDNNPTSGHIAPPLLNGSVAADPNCGLINYSPPGLAPVAAGSDKVTLAYTASHPRGFAKYDFVLTRGVTELEPPTVKSAPSGGSFSSSPAVSDLLGGCAIAGFTEALVVRGTATDGWGRQGYDAHDLRTFVLAPSPARPAAVGGGAGTLAQAGSP